jgi:hypothetical protein
MQSFPLKRGDTLSLAGTVSLPNLTWTPVCQVRDAKLTLLQTLAVALTPPASPPASGDWTYSILIAGTSVQTQAWPVSRLFCDVRFVNNSTPAVVRTFPTFAIDVVQEQSDV